MSYCLALSSKSKHARTRIFPAPIIVVLCYVIVNTLFLRRLITEYLPFSHILLPEESCHYATNHLDCKCYFPVHFQCIIGYCLFNWFLSLNLASPQC